MKLLFEDGVKRAQPDPFMCETKSGWAMYVTAVDGVEAYEADSPFGIWKYKGVVCHVENAREYWAPCMIYIDGWYYLYFSCAYDDGDESECMHVARAKNPFGTFEEVRRLYEHFSIDPHVVRTEAGLFLWYAKDNKDCERVGTRVWVERLLDPYTPEGNPREVIVPTFDEEIFMRNRYGDGRDWHTIEGAFWLQHGQYQYVMYSGACYQNDTYHIGYAVAKTEEPDLTKVSFEKYTDRGKFKPLMTKNEYEEGVGHHSVIYYDGDYHAVYHGRDVEEEHDGWQGTSALRGDRRTARICKLNIADGVITAERKRD